MQGACSGIASYGGRGAERRCEVLRPAMAADIDTLRVSITAVWLVELGISRSGVFRSWYRWPCTGEGQKDEGLV